MLASACFAICEQLSMSFRSLFGSMPILLLLLWNTCQGEQGSEAVESPPGELVLYRDSLNCFERIAYTKDVW